MKHHYTDLTTALADPEGVAVLGFFYEVNSAEMGADEAESRRGELTPPLSFQRSNSANRKYEPLVNALRSVKAAGRCRHRRPVAQLQAFHSPLSSSQMATRLCSPSLWHN